MHWSRVCLTEVFYYSEYKQAKKAAKQKDKVPDIFVYESEDDDDNDNDDGVVSINNNAM